LEVRKALTEHFNLPLNNGYILHVGGNQWYKNRLGIIEIYNAWCKKYKTTLPLIFIGQKPNNDLLASYNKSPHKEDIHFLSNVSDEYVRKAYAGSSVFLFPSLAEGFGWPIAEAMASGCPVITTNEVPMSEVASDAGFYIKLRPSEPEKVDVWASESSQVLDKVLKLSSEDRNAIKLKGLENAKRFNQNDALNCIEKIYQQILEQEEND
jgi:glycosyltransferase involved in cell wall biosynthesis